MAAMQAALQKAGDEPTPEEIQALMNEMASDGGLTPDEIEAQIADILAQIEAIAPDTLASLLAEMEENLGDGTVDPALLAA